MYGLVTVVTDARPVDCDVAKVQKNMWSDVLSELKIGKPVYRNEYTQRVFIPSAGIETAVIISCIHFQNINK